jgi:RNA polymerase sigma-70 factor (ECF subfamily)
VPEAEWVGWVQQIAAGDQRALHTLYTRMHRIVFTSVLRIVKTPEAAEELTVDVFHDVWKRAPTYDPATGTVVGWIMNQARSRAIDRLRFEQRKKRTNPHPQDASAEGGPDTSAEALEFARQQNRLRSALAELNPAERAAIETAFFSEYTYVETAARLNQPLGTIKTRIRSGLTKLRRVLGTV